MKHTPQLPYQEPSGRWMLREGKGEGAREEEGRQETKTRRSGGWEGGAAQQVGIQASAAPLCAYATPRCQQFPNATAKVKHLAKHTVHLGARSCPHSCPHLFRYWTPRRSAPAISPARCSGCAAAKAVRAVMQAEEHSTWL